MAAPAFNFQPNPEANARSYLDRKIEQGRRGMFTEVVDVTPELAVLLLERNSRNRTVWLKEVKNFEKIIRQGRWLLTHQGISINTDGVLGNGQHRLMAIRNTQCTVPISITFGEPPEAFAIIDKQRSRTGADTLGILGEKNGTFLSAALKLIYVIETGCNPTDKVEADLLEATLIKHPKIRDMYAPATKLKSSVNVSTAGSSVALYLILTTSPKAHRYEEFADKLLTGANLAERNDPILMLRTLLAKSTRLRAFEIGAMITMCWNAWIENKHPRSLRFEGGSFPKPI